jgi:hypothetical protein
LLSKRNLHRYVTVKLHLGEAVFDVVQGITFMHSEQVACVDTAVGLYTLSSVDP